MSYRRAWDIDPTANTDDEVFAAIRWELPGIYNIAEATCCCHAAQGEFADRIAMYYEDEAGAKARNTFRQFKDALDELALALSARNLNRKDFLP